MPCVLLVDDEKDIIEFLTYNLVQEGFSVISANNGSDALRKAEEKPDLIVLDVMMPVMDGFETCRRLRQNPVLKDIPVIFLTARASEKDEVIGLNLGAADYIAKPVSPARLIARVKTNLRKTPSKIPAAEKPPVVTYGPVIADRQKYLVTVNGVEKAFARKEFELLFYLIANVGNVCTRESLLKDVWGENIYVVDRTIDVHVRKIREKLAPFDDCIETVKGVGYRLKELG